MYPLSFGYLNVCVLDVRKVVLDVVVEPDRIDVGVVGSLVWEGKAEQVTVVGDEPGAVNVGDGCVS